MVEQRVDLAEQLQLVVDAQPSGLETAEALVELRVGVSIGLARLNQLLSPCHTHIDDANDAENANDLGHDGRGSAADGGDAAMDMAAGKARVGFICGVIIMHGGVAEKIGRRSGRVTGQPAAHVRLPNSTAQTLTTILWWSDPIRAGSSKTRTLVVAFVRLSVLICQVGGQKEKGVNYSVFDLPMLSKPSFVFSATVRECFCWLGIVKTTKN